MRAFWLVLLVAVPAQAAINDPLPFSADYAYTSDAGRDDTTVVSGALVATLRDVSGAFGFFATEGVAIGGLEKVCWTSSGGEACTTGDLRLVIGQGGSFGLDLAGPTDATYTADHALALFMDYEGHEDLNSFDVTKTLTAAAVNGRVTFTRVPTASVFFGQGRGGLAGLDADTSIKLYDGNTLYQDFTGKAALFAFEGAPEIPPFAADFVILPFEDTSRADFVPAAHKDADTGLRFQRLTQLFDALDRASARDEARGRQEAPALGDLQTVLNDVMRGALLRIPADSQSLAQEFAFVRFQDLHVLAFADDLRWTGTASLQVKEGRVVGAPELVGVGWFGLPWWSLALWVLALGVWITRLVVKPPKEHPTWDRLKWVGWVAGILSFLLLFWLWDLEVRSVWGTSLLSTSASGQGLLVTAAVQLLPLLYVLFAVAAPLRMGLRNGLLLARQGTFMGLSGAVSYLLSYLLGATLLLAYLDIVLENVLEQAGG